MKMYKSNIIIGLLVVLTGSAMAVMPKDLPKLKNAQELEQWRMDVTAKAGNSAREEQQAFYTGKPYIVSTGGYAFKYRNYNPAMARWTTEDPSGFPDGANNHQYISNSPTSNFDYMGLETRKFNASYNDSIRLNPKTGLNIGTNLNVTNSGIFEWNFNTAGTHFTQSSGSWTSAPVGTTSASGYTISNGPIAAISGNGQSVTNVDVGRVKEARNGKWWYNDWVNIKAYYTISTGNGNRLELAAPATNKIYAPNWYE
jgi:RHS repeat-associated protein